VIERARQEPNGACFLGRVCYGLSTNVGETASPSSVFTCAAELHDPFRWTVVKVATARRVAQTSRRRNDRKVLPNNGPGSGATRKAGARP
jgi:hypothetical protein